MPSPKRAGPRSTAGTKPAMAAKEPAKAADDTTAIENSEAEDTDVDDVEDSDAERPARARRSLPKITVRPTYVVAALLVILLAVGTWLVLNRPTGGSAIELTSFGEILSAARSGVVDVTSFDYLTIDQDLAEIEEVTTGDLRDEVLATLNERREQLVTDQQVSSTEVIAASLTEASAAQATALIVLRARQKSLVTPQETVTRYRVEITLELVDGRWLLSGLTGR